MAAERKNDERLEAFQHAKEIYKSETGYRAINNFLSRQIHSNSFRYKQCSMMSDPRCVHIDDMPIAQLIADLEWGMNLKNRQKTNEDKYDSNQTFYRGGSCDGKRSYRLETFLSMSDDKSEAESYRTEDGCLFRIKLDPGIHHTMYRSEGETVLIHGCFWEYKGVDPKTGDHRVEVHSPEWKPPKNVAFPWKGTPQEKKVEMTEKEYREQWLEEQKKRNEENEEKINWDGGRRKKRKTRKRCTRRQHSIRRRRNRVTSAKTRSRKR